MLLYGWQLLGRFRNILGDFLVKTSGPTATNRCLSDQLKPGREWEIVCAQAHSNNPIGTWE